MMSESEVRGVLSALLQEVLGAGITAEQNFFERGGTSVMSIQLISRVEAQFAVRVPMALMFEPHTLPALTAHILTSAAALPEVDDDVEVGTL